MPRVREQLTADAPIVVIERRVRDRTPRPFIGIGLHLQRAGFGIKADHLAAAHSRQRTSAERHVGTESARTCRSRWSPGPAKKHATDRTAKSPSTHTQQPTRYRHP